MAATGGGVLHDLWRLTRTTVSICMRHRVTGLAAEIGFFALLSLPPLVLGLLGTLGYFADIIGPDTVEDVRAQIIELSRHALSDDAVADVIEPTLQKVFESGRIDIVSFGFLLSLWSGSRALNVIIDTITIMYGLGGKRGIIATRALSFSLYLVALLVGVVLVPLVLAGPQLAAETLPQSVDWLSAIYWPTVVILSVASLTTLFWISVPVPNSWWRGVPGSVLALLGWVAGSYVVRVVLDWSVGGWSIYGPLAASIVVLIWLYALAITMLIGAAFNAAVDRRWPQRLDVTPVHDLEVDTQQLLDPPPGPLPVLHMGLEHTNPEYSRDNANGKSLPFAEPDSADHNGSALDPEHHAEHDSGHDSGHDSEHHGSEQEVKRHGRL